MTSPVVTAANVHCQIEAGIANVVLHNPGKLNAMSRAMWRALRQVFVALQSDPAVRCVLVRGEGGAFCAGGDISEYADFRFEEPSLRAFHEEDVWGGLQAMLDCDVPVLAAIDGACMGAGVEIAACCDIRLAAADAKFGAPIARLGFPMAPREAALLLRVAGEATLRQMLLAAQVLDAATMAQRGFVQQVVASDALAAQAQTTAQRIASLAPQAARMNKQILRQLSQQNSAEIHTGKQKLATDLIANAYHYASHPEHREGVSAFVEKRQPRF